MNNLLKVGFLLSVSLTVVGCASDGLSPMQRLDNRVSAAAAAGNNAVVRSTETLRCQAGMIAQSDEADVTSDARVEYEERHGDSGGSSYGRGGGNEFATYSSADVRVRAAAQSSANRRIKCVRPISLSLPPR